MTQSLMPWVVKAYSHPVAPILATGLVSCAIAMDLYSTNRSWLSHPPKAAAHDPLVVTNDGFQKLLNGHLFGAPPVAAASKSTLVASAYKLSGTIALEDPAQGYGFISENGAPAALYRAGAVLPSGARLSQVFAQSVTLEINGKSETLELPRGSTPGTGVAYKARGATGPRKPIPKTEMPVSAVKLPEKFDPSRPPNVVPRTPLLRALRPSPLLVDGYLLGYRLSSSGGSVALPGLAPENVIVSINGVKLEDGNVATGAFEALLGSRSAVVTVLLPNGGTRDVTIDTSNLESIIKPRKNN